MSCKKWTMPYIEVKYSENPWKVNFFIKVITELYIETELSVSDLCNIESIDATWKVIYRNL